MKSYLILTAIIIIAILSSCSKDTSTGNGNNNEPPVSTDTPNILFIIADDLGKDAINGFAELSIKPKTPNIDAIRTGGLSFTNFWTYPTCTPTRSSIITGKYGYRTNVKSAGDVMSPSEVVLQKYIFDNTNSKYASAIVGKWHLSGNNSSANPETYGIDYYAGLVRGAVDDYYRWQFTEDGVTSLKTTYTTELFTDLSIDWINKQSKPWFMWLAYNAPHTPFHAPPSDMHSQGNLVEFVDGMDPIPYFMAAIEAMDFQIGRLLSSMSDEEKANTIIIFIGDNGTPNEVAQSPYTSTTVKNTLFQGGINTPLFISGKGVTRTGNDVNLITTTDLFSTMAQIAGVSTSSINDSKSFKSLLTQSSTIREFQYAENINGTTEEWTINNGKYKLMVNDKGVKKMYDLAADPYEKDNLMSKTLSSTATTALSSLETELAVIRN